MRRIAKAHIALITDQRYRAVRRIARVKTSFAGADQNHIAAEPGAMNRYCAGIGGHGRGRITGYRTVSDDFYRAVRSLVINTVRAAAQHHRSAGIQYDVASRDRSFTVAKIIIRPPKISGAENINAVDVRPKVDAGGSLSRQAAAGDRNVTGLVNRARTRESDIASVSRCEISVNRDVRVGIRRGIPIAIALAFAFTFRF